MKKIEINGETHYQFEIEDAELRRDFESTVTSTKDAFITKLMDSLVASLATRKTQEREYWKNFEKAIKLIDPDLGTINIQYDYATQSFIVERNWLDLPDIDLLNAAKELLVTKHMDFDGASAIRDAVDRIKNNKNQK